MRHNTPSKTIVAYLAALLIAACAVSAEPAPPTDAPVLFVCEHGNVKSLMAASYFNRLAIERNLPYRAVSRGVAPDSATVPPAIIAGLRSEGFEVATFRPAAVDAATVATARRVILISTSLPESMPVGAAKAEQWTDVPPASADYAAASAALRKHVERLVDDISQATNQPGARQ